MSKYIELAKKIKALADRGVDGEKDNAEKLLKEIMQKHNISIEDLEDEKIESFYFNIPTYSHDLEFKIFHQLTGIFGLKTYGKFLPKTIKEYGLKGNYMIECSKIVYIEIKAKYEFYCQQFKTRLDEFFYAFCMKNNLLVPSKKTTDDINPEERKKMINAMKLSRELEADNFAKQIQ